MSARDDLDMLIEDMTEATDIGRRTPNEKVLEWLATLRDMRARAVEVRAEAVDPDDTACPCADSDSWEVHRECEHVWKIGKPALLILGPEVP